jgi:glycine/D-amino acid oxidase-like deaminating enzyme
MDLRTHYPYSLLRYGLIRSYPSLDKNIKTDVAIIGAGVSGAMVAWQLQKAGINSVVLDKRHVATGSTAASTSLIQYEIDKPLHWLIDRIGHKNAVRSYLLCRQAIDDLRQLCSELGEEENFENKKSLQFASSQKHLAGMEKEFHLRKQLGFLVDLLDKKQLEKEYGFSAPGGLLSHEAAQADAYLLTHNILKNLDKNVCPIYDHTEIVSVRHERRQIVLVTGEGQAIQTRKLVIACGYESGRYLRKKIEDLRCTYAMISEPLRQKEPWKDNCLIWETADPYLYLRVTRDGRILIGGKDTRYFGLKRQMEILPKKSDDLRKTFQKIFPHIPVKIDFQWAGAFAATKDGLPYIGSVPDLPGTYFALGYGGNGITFSLIAAQMISCLIRGKKHPDLDIFSFDRR